MTVATEPGAARRSPKTRRIPIVPVGRPTTALPKPAWLRVPLPAQPGASGSVKRVLREQSLHTVCEEARCPNIGECFSSGTATFMVLGDLCTRRCPFCDVAHGRPQPPDAAGAARTWRETVARLRLELRRHHQRRSRRPARRRRGALRRLHPRRARALAAHAHRGADAGLPRPPRGRARRARGRAARRDEPQPRDRAAAVPPGASRRRLRALAAAARRRSSAAAPAC